MQIMSTFLRVVESRNSSILGARDMTLDSIIEGTNRFDDPASRGGFILGTIIQFEELCFGIQLRVLEKDRDLRSVILIGMVIVVATSLTTSASGTDDIASVECMERRKKEGGSGVAL